MHSCYRSLVGKNQRGTVFHETLWLSCGEVIALSCVDVYIDELKGEYNMIVCVFCHRMAVPGIIVYVSSKCLKGRETQILVASTLGSYQIWLAFSTPSVSHEMLTCQDD